MSTPSFPQSVAINASDFTVHDHFFSALAKELLPLPGVMQFWSLDCARQITHGTLGEKQKKSLSSRLPGICQNGKLVHHEHLLFFPLINTKRLKAVGIIDTGKSDLFHKISNDWLPEFKTKLLSQFLVYKQTKVDFATGLYNGFFLQENCTHLLNIDTSFALIFIGLKNKSRKNSSFNLQETIRNAHFLAALVSSPLYHLGNGVFALLYEGATRQNVMQNCHRLLTLLKRQPYQKVQIGVHTVIPHKNETAPSEKSQGSVKPHYFDQCRQAFEEAGRRGPFSICSSWSHRKQNNHPFSLPADNILRALRRKWRGVEKFSLILIRYDKQDPGTPLLSRQIHSFIDEQSHIFPVSPEEAFILLPNMDSQKSLEWAQNLQTFLLKSNVPPSISMGISNYPLLNTSKTATIINCKKAIRHGKFLGPNSLTLFDSVSLNISGDYFFDEGDLRQAAREYRQGLLLDPDDLNLMNSLGVSYAEMNRHREAALLFEKVTAKKTDNFMALLNLGHSYRIQGRKKEAMASYEMALNQHQLADDQKKSSHYNDLLLQLSRLYNRQGRYSEALHLIETLRAEKHHQEEFIIYRILGEALMETGEDKKAMRVLQQALQLYPHDGDSLSMLGELYLRTGQGNDIALSFCRQALVIDDRNWRYRQRLGRVFFVLNRFDEARREARKSLQLKKSNLPATLLMGEIYEKLGQRQRAITMYQRILQGPNINKILRLSAEKKLQHIRR